MAEDIKPAKKPQAVAKCVILHTQVGAFTRGQVVPVTAFADMTRMLNLKAVRQATEEESVLERVSLDDLNRPTSEVDGLRNEVARLRAIADAREAEIQKLRTLNESQAAATGAIKVNELANRLNEAEKTIKALQAELAEKKAELAKINAGE